MSIPKTGGSYVRKPDGSLQRVAFTEHRVATPAPAPQPAANPADTTKTNAKG